MKRKFTSLIEVRKLMALGTTLLFIGLASFGILEPVFIQTMITTVVAYYFGKSTALDKPNRKDEE